MYKFPEYPPKDDDDDDVNLWPLQNLLMDVLSQKTID